MQPNAYKCLVSRMTTCTRYSQRARDTAPLSSSGGKSTAQQGNTYDDYDDHELLYELSLDNGNSNNFDFFSRRSSANNSFINTNTSKRQTSVVATTTASPFLEAATPAAAADTVDIELTKVRRE